MENIACPRNFIEDVKQMNECVLNIIYRYYIYIKYRFLFDYFFQINDIFSLKWTLFDSTKFAGYPKEAIHRRMGRPQGVANKFSGNIFVTQISSATKLKGHLMKNKRCR